MYSPSQVCAAAGNIKASTLRAWHNTDGLAIGTHRPNGHRAYSETDAALLMWVSRQTGADGAGLGFMQHGAAVKIANKLQEPLALIWSQYRAVCGVDAHREMDADWPMAFAYPHSAGFVDGWEVEVFVRTRDWAGVLLDHRIRRGTPVLIELSTIMRVALYALSRTEFSKELDRND